MNDEQLLAGIPEFLSIGSLLKATPSSEGTKRIVYFEASNEGLDQQGEVVAAKALSDSADYFLRYGNIDIDHYSMIGAKSGIPDYAMFEIGRPVDVRQENGKTFVKAEIYAGDGPAANRANQFWSSIVDVQPAARWYPSVGGAILEKAIEIDPATKMRKAIIKRVRWSNIGVSKTPVNQHVGTCATVPVGAFAKCWTAGGLDLAKALEAGYGTDSADLSGGGALRQQSLAPPNQVLNYFDFQNKLSKHLRNGKVGVRPGVSDLLKHAQKHFGMPLDTAAEWVERYSRDIKSKLTR